MGLLYFRLAHANTGTQKNLIRLVMAGRDDDLPALW